MSVCRIVTVFFVVVAAVLVVKRNGANADDIGTNFFLKASKSVPRIGRRSMDFENYFLKASKTVPRIGRRINIPVTNTGPNMEKKYFSEKYFPDTGNSWGSIDHKEYASIMLDEPYRESVEQYPDSFWQRVRKNFDTEEPRHVI